MAICFGMRRRRTFSRQTRTVSSRGWTSSRVARDTPHVTGFHGRAESMHGSRRNGKIGSDGSRRGGTEMAAERGSRGNTGGIGLGGILVIVGIVVMIVWSFWVGLIVLLVGLIAFGRFARGEWKRRPGGRLPRHDLRRVREVDGQGG